MFGDYIDYIYPVELEIKDTTDADHQASYLDLGYDRDKRLQIKLYDKRDDFNFNIVNFPFLSSNIPRSPAYGVYVSQLICYARASSAYSDFLVRKPVYIRLCCVYTKQIEDVHDIKLLYIHNASLE